MNTYESQSSLAPRRRASLGIRQRPVTACAPGHDFPSFTRSKGSRLSLGPGYEYDVLDWRSFSPNQERHDRTTTTPDLSSRMTEPVLQQHSTSFLLPTRPHQRRPSYLSQSLRSGFNEMCSLGRKLSLTVKGRSARQKDEGTESRRSQFLSLKSDEKMMDLNEAISTRPKSRGWKRTPSTRRRPSLPLLNFSGPDPWHTSVLQDVRDMPPDTPLPRSRGQPVLSDLVFGGAGARASAAAHNELYDATRTPPLPPYEPETPKFSPARDSESGIGISIDAHSRRSSIVSMPERGIQDPTTVLAPELQECIFKLLDAESLTKARLVSHQWKRVCESQAVWREVFLRKYGVKQPNPFLRTRCVPGLGRNTPGQDYKKLYQIRSLIDKRWQRGEAAAIYLNGHKDSVYCVQFDEHKIITGSRDNTIRVWDAHNYQCVKKLGPHNNPRERLNLERAAVEPSGVLPFFKADVTSPDPAAGPLPHWHKASVLCLQYDDEISGDRIVRFHMFSMVNQGKLYAQVQIGRAPSRRSGCLHRWKIHHYLFQGYNDQDMG